MNTILELNFLTYWTRRFLAMLCVLVLSSCGGGDNAPTVAGSNLVPVAINMQVAGQSAANVGPAVALPGAQSVRITISGVGFAPIVDIFNATPGATVTRNFNVPQGIVTFTIEAFNGPLGTGVVTFSGSAVAVVAPQAVGAPALAIDVIVAPTQGALRQLQGVVKDTTQTPIPGATISVVGAGVNLTATTDVAGVYAFPSVFIGTHAVTAVAAGFNTATATFDLTGAGSITVPEIFLSPVNVAAGSLTGIVKNAVTLATVVGATVNIRQGVNAPVADPVIATVVSAAGGTYTVPNLAAGTYTATASNAGFADSNISVAVSGGGAVTTATPIMLASILAAGETRIVLSWGNLLSDMDAHLVGPVNAAATGSQEFQIFFGRTGSEVVSPFALLHNDITRGFGPEATTVSQKFTGTYRYYARGFSVNGQANSTVLSANSRSIVQVYQGTAAAPVATFHVPVTGAGDVWHVFDMDGVTGAITAVDQIALSTTIPAVVSVTSTGGVVLAGVTPAVVPTAGMSATEKLNAFSANQLVTPARVVIAVVAGATQQLTTSVEAVGLNTLPFTGTFVSSNPAVASVDANGLVTALTVGTANITVAEPVFGASAISAITVTAADTTPPVVAQPANISVEATGPTTGVALVAPAVTDNVDVGLAAAANNLGPFSVGVTTVTWSATDLSGNTGTVTQTVTVTDTTPPTVTAPTAITIDSNVAVPVANAGIQAFLNAASANDLVDGAIVPSNDAPVVTFPLGVTTVIFSAVDALNNTAAASSTVTVVDQTAPTVVSQNPVNGATGVSVNSAISVIFSEAMNTATVNGNTFFAGVTGGGAVIGTLSFDVTGTVATIVPNGNLLPNTNYTATVATSAMTDVAGNLIGPPNQVSNFTTGASVVTLPPVLPVVQGQVVDLGAFDGFSMLWSGTANGANQANRWTGALANPTTTLTGVESFVDGNVIQAVAGGALPSVIAANRIMQIGALNSGDNLAASISLDGQLMAATNLDVGLQTVEQMLFVQQRVPIHTATTVAGLYNTVQFIRIPGPGVNTTATSNGVLTVNANGTWSFAGTGTSIDPATLLLNNPFNIIDNGTFVIDANGVAITTSAVNPNTISRSMVSADGNYIILFRMDTVSGESGVMIGVRQHTTTVNVANTTLTDVRISLSELVPVSAMAGEVGIFNVDANGLLTSTHGSRTENAVVCGVGTPPNQPNCQFQVDPATTVTSNANGLISIVDTTGATFSAFASQNGNVMISEDPGRGVDVVIRQ